MPVFSYVLEPISTGISEANHDIYKVNFKVVSCYDAEYPNDVEIELEGQVHWDDGVHIWQTEGLEQRYIAQIFSTIEEAVKASIRLIGKHKWSVSGGNKWPDEE